MRTMALTPPSPVRSAIGEFTEDESWPITYLSMSIAVGRTRSHNLLISLAVAQEYFWLRNQNQQRHA